MLLLGLLIACSTHRSAEIPVVDLANQHEEARGYHEVQPGETLYFIAWRFGKDFVELADTNHLSRPYSLNVGQKIYLNANTNQTKSSKWTKPVVVTVQSAKTGVIRTSPIKPVPISKPSAPPLSELVSNKPVKKWLRPAQGTIIDRYTPNLKGINIAGQLGESVLATAAGEVVYAGNGLRGYGNLILIKHNDIYMSAYAHNQRILVSEGDYVKAGQVVAQMGSTDADRVMLHFELRQRGKSVNPLKYF